MINLRRRISATVAAVLASAVTATAAPAAPAAAQHPGHEPGPTSYAEAGPYGVGERTLKLRSGAKVEVWYPARQADVRGRPVGTYDIVDWLPEFLAAGLPEGTSVTHPSGGVRGVPVARKRFPLVVFSHGYAGFRTQSSALTAALASWGFVVAAPDHHSRSLTQVMLGPKGTTTDVRDLRDTITLIGRRTASKHSWLHRRVDMHRIGAVGHSAGGRAVENLALVDRRVDTFVGMAGASAGALDEEAAAPRKPGLLLAGTADAIVGLDRMEQAYTALRRPKRIVLLDNAGHLAFSDLCEIAGGQGGLLAVAELVGVTVPPNLVPLATDGCLEPALEPTLAWPAIHHIVVAHLRHVLGTDDTDTALTGLVDAYPGIVSDSRSAP